MSYQVSNNIFFKMKFLNNVNCSYSGFLTAFGFCDYGDPEAGLRAIRLLHGKELGDKALVVSIILYLKLVNYNIINYYYNFFGLFHHTCLLHVLQYKDAKVSFNFLFLNYFVYFKKIKIIL